ncbi:hypothetical protein [Falsirhodobacter sp. 20TX0035]|uniref:hypothetical protein n=1 Tax=Falsirhodobacter sp. 20TX0035 TaxID=3022019 RepID=UPI002330EDFB|nr:hypothetical protein [Falsirhodobacter sp. 20TX0035]MDB6452173.1 hypothetical protein [Falsirhodobacter sp. 20TX0035]
MAKTKFVILAAVLATGTIAGCSQPYSNSGYGGGYGNSPVNNAAVRTLGGAAAGAVIADATGGGKTKGALIGALAGGGSCMVPGQNCN